MKAKHTETKITEKPAAITVAIPNTTVEKMKAITSLASAIESLARTLESTNVNVRIENNSIEGCTTGINITNADMNYGE